MSLPCCWPPSDEAPAAPLRVNAGPDSSVDVGDPLTLAGSASGGTPSYVFQWSQVSGPGTATFVDFTDPATDVTFDVAGEYVLRLAAEDSLGQVAADQVTETVDEAPLEFPTIEWGEAGGLVGETPGGVTWSPDLNLFVLVTFGVTQNIYSGTDGVNWTLRQSTGHGMTWVTWCPISQIFMTADNTHVWTSPNGTAWTQAGNSPLDPFSGVEAVDGSLLLSGSGGQFYRSVDGGATWVPHASPNANTYKGLATKPSTITGSVGDGSTTANAANSANSGVTWNAAALPGADSNTYLYRGTFAPELDTFAAVGNDGAGSGALWTSPDALAWTQGVVPADPLLLVVCEVNRAPNPYILVAGSANPTKKLLASYDGVTWLSDNGPLGDNFTGLAYNSTDNILVMTSYNGDIYAGTPA